MVSSASTFVVICYNINRNQIQLSPSGNIHYAKGMLENQVNCKPFPFRKGKNGRGSAFLPQSNELSLEEGIVTPTTPHNPQLCSCNSEHSLSTFDFCSLIANAFVVPEVRLPAPISTRFLLCHYSLPEINHGDYAFLRYFIVFTTCILLRYIRSHDIFGNILQIM